jgi:hypothetical protein
MNTIKTMVIIAGLATVLFATQSCDNKNNHQNDDMHDSDMTKNQMHSGNMQDAYSCPMHPEHSGIKGGKCQECGMELEKMSRGMMNQNHMQMMMKDSTMMHNMMGNMMNNPKMMGNMMQMMQKEGIMNQECMQSCLKMMGDKGLNMGNMMQDGSMKNNELHNH